MLQYDADDDGGTDEGVTALSGMMPRSPGSTQMMSHTRAVAASCDEESSLRYSVNGSRKAKSQPGINIIRKSDGTVRKVVVK